MRSNPPIQFRGVANVLDAYTKFGVPSWALFQANQLLFHEESNDVDSAGNTLRDYLNMMKRNNNPKAVYTLCLYDELPANGKINSNTPYTGSFNFKLNEFEEEQSFFNNPLLQQIEDLKQELAEIREEEPPKTGIGAVLDSLLQNEQVQSAIVGRVINFVEQIFPAPSVKVAGFVPTANHSEPQTSFKYSPMEEPVLNDEQTRFNDVITRLLNRDPFLLEHLEKLANIAETDPQQFKILITILNAK